MTFAVIWYILCRAAKFIDGLKCSKAFVAVYCFIVHGSEVPSELVQLVTDVCCVGLHCDAEGWSHLVTDHLFGPLQEQSEGRQFHGYEEVGIALREWLQKF